ncbi:nuclear transport factor 2 family protein [Flavitalea antarctica]
MQTTTEIGDTFSKGDFKSVYDSFDDHIQWNIVGSPAIIGKENVIAHCNKMLAEMDNSSMTNTHHIVTDDTVVVQGYSSFTNQDNSPGKVEYCDIFRFDNNKLVEITSYIIEVLEF